MATSASNADWEKALESLGEPIEGPTWAQVEERLRERITQVHAQPIKELVFDEIEYIAELENGRVITGNPLFGPF